VVVQLSKTICEAPRIRKHSRHRIERGLVKQMKRKELHLFFVFFCLVVEGSELVVPFSLFVVRVCLFACFFLFLFCFLFH
jgi:hypothetical protein